MIRSAGPVLLLGVAGALVALVGTAGTAGAAIPVSPPTDLVRPFTGPASTPAPGLPSLVGAHATTVPIGSAFTMPLPHLADGGGHVCNEPGSAPGGSYR